MSGDNGTIHCDTHGESQRAFVCTHLTGDTFGRGFNRKDPTQEEPYPDAWCDDCEIIRMAADGWNEENGKLADIKLLCAECYERACIRNTKPTVPLSALGDLRWKCGSCDKWHTGPLLDYGFTAPIYWTDEHARVNKRGSLFPGLRKKPRDTFLNEDYCAIENRDFFVRGIIELPILGTEETFRWGVWGSLKKENFERLLAMDDDAERVELEPMFAWLSNEIPEYPSTINLPMYAIIQEPGWRPKFRLNKGDHPLAQEYYSGISPERVREITHKLTAENS